MTTLTVNGTVRAVDGTYAAYGQKLEIDRGVIGRVKKQNLRHGRYQRPFQRAGFFRQPAFEIARQRFANCAKPTQRNRCDRPGKSAVPPVEVVVTRRRVR